MTVRTDRERGSEDKVHLGPRFRDFTFIAVFRNELSQRYNAIKDIARNSSVAGVRLELVAKAGARSGVFKRYESSTIEHFDLLAMIRRVGAAAFLKELFVWDTQATAVLQLQSGATSSVGPALLQETISPLQSLQICSYYEKSAGNIAENLVHQMLGAGWASEAFYSYDEATKQLVNPAATCTVEPRVLQGLVDSCVVQKHVSPSGQRYSVNARAVKWTESFDLNSGTNKLISHVRLELLHKGPKLDAILWLAAHG